MVEAASFSVRVLPCACTIGPCRWKAFCMPWPRTVLMLLPDGLTVKSVDSQVHDAEVQCTTADHSEA